MTAAPLPTPETEEQPFPLRRLFRRWVLPMLLVLLVAEVGLSAWGGWGIIHDIYLEVARGRAEGIAAEALRRDPEAWQALAASSPRDGALKPDILARLDRVLNAAVADARLAKLKIYDRWGRLLYGTGLAPEATGIMVNDPALAHLLANGTPQVVEKQEPSGPLYELYVWLPVSPDLPGADHQKEDPPRHPEIGLVFELYEPTSHLDALLTRNLSPLVLVPSGLLVLALLVLARLVTRAQGDIDHRTEALIGLKRRLERLVSPRAVGAARRALLEGKEVSRLMDATLYYADVVSFTSYAEAHPPQRVVAFLNRVVTVQVEAIHHHGGDIDKMIGDAVLAVFEGSDRAARATACACDVLLALAAMPDLPRGLRIGLHDGFVIAGAIGPEERQDFTVIGDGVNVAARLCAAADEGGIAADVRTLARAGHPEGFGPVEEISVKGRSEPLRIRRWGQGHSARCG